MANPLAEQVLSGDVEAGARVEIDVDGDAPAFEVVNEPGEEVSDTAVAEPLFAAGANG